MLDVQVVQTEELEKVIEAPEARPAPAEKVERPDEAEADGPPVAEGASHAAEPHAAHEEKAEALTPEQTSDTLAAAPRAR